mmetsp:Transcript_720/g.923  ORF Transcript_720/g.923 Transcript_720/m.923 type:complete len:412 (+) Transcript_720:322-1557(+)
MAQENGHMGRNLLSRAKEHYGESQTCCALFNQNEQNRPILRSILLGQLLSLLIAGTGVFTTELKTNGINFPAFQISFTYLILFSYLGFRKKKELKISWWKYSFLAILDVEANYLVVMAYKYTSITSVMLLDCFTIPAAMVLSRIFLHAKYKKMHVVGAVCSICGLVLTVFSDIWQNRMVEDPEHPHALLGDILCLVGAVLYASMNVLEEAVVKRASRVEFLGMLGGWGFLISMVQAALLEQRAFSSFTSWGNLNIGYLVAFTACMVAMYTLTAIFLQLSDSTMFNISLLTSDVYAVLFAVLTYHQAVNWIYSISFFVTLAGLLIYSNQPLATAHLCSKENEEVLDLIMAEDISNNDPWDTGLDREDVLYDSREEDHFVNSAQLSGQNNLLKRSPPPGNDRHSVRSSEQYSI